MTLIVRPAALDALEATAREAGLAEGRFREDFVREIARLEGERRTAFRRFHFLAALVAADAGTMDREASRAAQTAAAEEELELSSHPSRGELLAALGPLSDAVHDERLIETREAEDAVVETVAYAHETDLAHNRSAALLFALADFEARFEEIGGRSFAAVFERHMPETPLVDF